MKKSFLFFTMLLAGLTVASCGNGSKESTTASVEETSIEENSDNALTEEANEAVVEEEAVEVSHLAVLTPEQIVLPSPIKGCVEIIPEDDGNVYVDFDSNNYPVISLTFKLLKKVGTSSLVSEYGQMWIVGHAQDAKGREIDDLNPKNITSREWRSGDSDGKEFKEFLEGDIDETITLQFTGESNIELFEKDSDKIEAGKKKTEEAAKKLGKFKLSLTK